MRDRGQRASNAHLSGVPVIVLRVDASVQNINVDTLAVGTIGPSVEAVEREIVLQNKTEN